MSPTLYLELSSPVKNALQKIIPNIFVVSSETYCGLKIKKQTKYKKGADILATSCAANTLYGDSIVIDAGTATTLQIIKNREFLGYIIAPGLSMCAKALHDETSLLPLVDTPKNPACWGNNTIEAIQTGTFYGHALMIDALISEIEKKAKHKFKTIATGGNIPKLLNLMKRPFDVIDYELIFKGLKLIYNLNHEKTF